jgi:hypothetical protein
MIQAGGANLTITGSVKNTGSLDAFSLLDITGTVTGGAANIYSTGAIEFDGPSSVNVSFSSNPYNGAPSTGALLLGDATKFTGTVAGMSTNPGAGIVLGNIPFADGPVVSFNPTTHLLTVSATKQGRVITDKIKIVGTGTFAASPGLFGLTVIKDPPPIPASGPGTDMNLLVQSMASFGASSSVAASGTGGLAENYRSSDFLTPNSHHG